MPLPADYEPVIRPDDREHVGYLAAAGGLWQGLNLIGFPIGAPSDRDSALEAVIATGLASLDGAWWCRAPKPFPATERELRAAEPGWPWRKVAIVEVNAVACTVRPALAWPEEASALVRLALPVDDLLRTSPID